MAVIAMWNSPFNDYDKLGDNFADDSEFTDSTLFDADFVSEALVWMRASGRRGQAFPKNFPATTGAEHWFQARMYVESDRVDDDFDNGFAFRQNGETIGFVRLRDNNLVGVIAGDGNGGVNGEDQSGNQDMLGTYFLTVNISIDDPVGFTGNVRVRAWKSGVLIGESTRANVSASGIDELEISFRGNFGGGGGFINNLAVSELRYDTTSLFGKRVWAPTLSAGSVNDWSGDQADLLNNDVLAGVASDTTGDETLLAPSAYAGSSIASVDAVQIDFTAFSPPGGPTAVETIFNDGATTPTTGELGSDTTVSDAPEAYRVVADQNPTTSAAWSVSEIEGGEFGFRIP